MNRFRRENWVTLAVLVAVLAAASGPLSARAGDEKVTPKDLRVIGGVGLGATVGVVLCSVLDLYLESPVCPVDSSAGAFFLSASPSRSDALKAVRTACGQKLAGAVLQSSQGLLSDDRLDELLRAQATGAREAECRGAIRKFRIHSPAAISASNFSVSSMPGAPGPIGSLAEPSRPDSSGAAL